MNNNIQNNNQNINNAMPNNIGQNAPVINQNPMPNNNQLTQTKNNSNKLILIIVGIIAVCFIGIIGLLVFIAVNTFSSSDKLVCKSTEGSITISYDENTIIGYTASGISYDLEGQKKIAEQIGVSEYIEEFDKWFQKNTSGSCENKKKN